WPGQDMLELARPHVAQDQEMPARQPLAPVWGKGDDAPTRDPVAPLFPLGQFPKLGGRARGQEFPVWREREGLVLVMPHQPAGAKSMDLLFPVKVPHDDLRALFQY